MGAGTDPDPVPSLRVLRAGVGTGISPSIPHLLLTLPKTKRVWEEGHCSFAGSQIVVVIVVVVVVWRLVFQPREGIVREVFFLSVNFKIKPTS